MTSPSPVPKARLAGLCWLLCFVASAFGLFVGTRLIVPGKAAETAANLLAHEMLFRAGTSAMLVSGAFYLAATLLVYQLLKPVNRTIALLGVFFSLTGCAVGAIVCLLDFVPLLLLKNAAYANALGLEQVQWLALLSQQVRAQANNHVGLVFFGLHCLTVGFLIVRSTFLPRFLGLFMLFAGIGWLTFLWPPFARLLAPYNMLPGALGELVLSLWLLVKGVHETRWLKQAGRD